MKKSFASLALLAALGFGLTAHAADQTGTSKVSGEIVGSCTISATDADLGQMTAQFFAAAEQNSAVHLTVNCSNAMPYKVFLDSSAPASITASAAAGGAVTSPTFTVTNGVVTVLNGAAPMGLVKYWSDIGGTTKFDVDSSSTVRSGTGADQDIPVYISWTGQGAGALQAGSFGKFQITNTYHVSF